MAQLAIVSKVCFLNWATLRC